MFKMGLLTSTAMTAAALLLSDEPVGAYTQTDMHVASRDPNTRFLCTYGSFRVSAVSSSSDGPYYYYARRVAVPVDGRGQTVRRIRVIEERKSTYGRGWPYFTAGIYSNTPSGLPGKLIAAGTHSSMANSGCGPVRISVPPTKLKRKTTYWIEETAEAAGPDSGPASFYWAVSPNTNRKAYVQNYSFFYSSLCSCSDSYTSPWAKQPSGPYLKLR